MSLFDDKGKYSMVCVGYGTAQGEGKRGADGTGTLERAAIANAVPQGLVLVLRISPLPALPHGHDREDQPGDV